MWAQVVWATNVRGCIMAIWAISLRRSCLPPNGLAVDAHLGVLAGEAGGRGLAAGVGVDLRVEHEDLDVHAAGEHAARATGSRCRTWRRRRRCTRVGLSCQPIWSQRSAHAHGVGRGVLEQRVGPRHQVRVVGIGRGVDGVAAGGGDDAPLVAVLFEAGGGAASCAGPCPRRSRRTSRRRRRRACVCSLSIMSMSRLSLMYCFGVSGRCS